MFCSIVTRRTLDAEMCSQRVEATFISDELPDSSEDEEMEGEEEDIEASWYSAWCVISGILHSDPGATEDM